MQNASKYFFFTFHSSAEDTHNQTKAALKKLARPFQNEIFAKRCYREIRMLRHFDHENVSVQSSVDEVLRVDGGCVAGHEACRVKNKGRTVECLLRDKCWTENGGLFSAVVSVFGMQSGVRVCVYV